MVVERADSRFTTVVKTKDPRRLFTGEKSWSPLGRGETVILTLDKVPLRVAGFSQTVERDPVQDDTIHFFDLAIYGPGSSHIRQHRIVSLEEINKPDEPWAGTIRYTSPQGTQK